jgi:hypothetical protein
MLEPTEHPFVVGTGDVEGYYVINYADLGDKRLVPGIYKAPAALGLTGTLTLVGYNCDKWTIIIGGAFTTLAGSKMDTDGPVRSANVNWVVTGAITLGAGSTAVGSMETPAAMTVGAGNIASGIKSFAFDTAGTWTFTIGGALTMSALSYMTKVDGATVNWVVSGAITLGAQSIAVGDMESTFGAITLGADASSGNLKAAGALTLGAEAVTGTLQAGGAITVGAAAEPGVILDYTDCATSTFDSECPT